MIIILSVERRVPISPTYGKFAPSICLRDRTSAGNHRKGIETSLNNFGAATMIAPLQYAGIRRISKTFKKAKLLRALAFSVTLVPVVQIVAIAIVAHHDFAPESYKSSITKTRACGHLTWGIPARGFL